MTQKRLIFTLILATLMYCIPMLTLKALPWWISATPSLTSTPIDSGITLSGTFGGNVFGTASPPINYPDETKIGDIMLLVISTDTVSTIAGAAPAGWSLLHTIVVGTDMSAHVWWKRSTEANPANETWNSIFTPAVSGVYQVVSYTGCVASGTPINASQATSMPSSSSWTGSVTTTVNNCMVIGIFAADLPTGQTFIWSGSIIDRADRNNAGVGFLTIGDEITPLAGLKTMSGTPSVGRSHARFIYALTPL